jgi:hypothetical protein
MSLKGAWFQTVETRNEKLVSNVPFKFNLRRYTATALLRSSNYGIPTQSLFDAKAGICSVQSSPLVSLVNALD